MTEKDEETERESNNIPKSSNNSLIPGMDIFTVEEIKELINRATSPEISSQDKKAILIWMHEWLVDCGGIKRAIYKKVIKESIDWLDMLPPEAKKWNVQAYINFLKEIKEKNTLKNLGEEP